MARLFSLNQLRQKAAHRTGAGFAAFLAADLKTFGIDQTKQVAGWGTAVDAMYDGLIDDLVSLSKLLKPS